MSHDSEEIREEKKPDHHYRTEIPNVVFELGLSPYAFCLYSYYKKVAGDYGKCYKSRQKICKKLKISLSTLNKCRKELEKPRKELKNKSLISVEVRKNENDEYLPSIIRVVDIWRENGDYNREKNREKSSYSKGGVGREKNEGRPSEKRGRFSHGRKEDPLEEEPFEEEESDASVRGADLVSYLYQKILKLDPKAKKPGHKWYTAADRLLRLDERDIDEAKRVIDWVVNDPFWKKNILSMPKFREKYSQLLISMENSSNKTKSTQTFFNETSDKWSPEERVI